MASPPFGRDYHDYDATTQRTPVRSQEAADGLSSRLPTELGVAHGSLSSVTQPQVILALTDAPFIRSMRTEYTDPYLAQSMTRNLVPRLPPLDTLGPSTSNTLHYHYSSQSPMTSYPSFAGDSSTYPAHASLASDEHRHVPLVPSMPSYAADSPVTHTGPGTPFSSEGSLHSSSSSSSRPPSASSYHPLNLPGYPQRPGLSVGNSAYDVIHRPPPHRLLIRQRSERPSLAAAPFPRSGSSQWPRSAGGSLSHSHSPSSSRDPHSRDYPSTRYSHSSHTSPAPHSHSHHQHEDQAQVPGIASNHHTHQTHPNPSQMSGHPTPTATTPVTSLPPIPAPPSTLDSLRAYFPLDTPEHIDLRTKLIVVMNAPWRLSNEQEPEPGLLLQFTSKIETNGSEKYHCLFWSEGSECGKHIPRSDRMLEHLRRHIGVRPFVCDCNSDGCPGVFPSKSAMYQHQKNVEPVHCQRCGAQVLRQNLARHWRAQRCQRPDEAATEPDPLAQ